MGEPETGHKNNICFAVGDHSADRYAAQIIAHLKVLRPDIHIWGVGGHEMEAAGMELLLDTTENSVLGFIEVIPMVKYFFTLKDLLFENIAKRDPAVVLLMDNGGFNVRFADRFRKINKTTPMYYFISPQIWASRPWRIVRLRNTMTKILTIFPFEESIYVNQNVPARFVGHPLLTVVPEVDAVEDRDTFCKRMGINPEDFIIAILPGSRKNEIKAHMPVAIDAIKLIMQTRNNVSFVISTASHKTAPLIKETLEKGFSKEELASLLNKKIFVFESSENYPLMKNADIAWAKSGTTTLEVTLFGTPMIIFYRGAWSSFLIVQCLKTIKNVGLPNVLAGKTIVPELLQLDCRGELIVKYTLDMLDVPALREDMKRQLLTLRAELGSGNFVENCAEELLELITSKQDKGPI